MKSASWQNRCLGNTLTLSIKKMKTQFLLKQGDPLSFNYRSERGGAGVLRQVLGGLTYRSHQRDVLSPQCSSKKKKQKAKTEQHPVCRAAQSLLPVLHRVRSHMQNHSVVCKLTPVESATSWRMELAHLTNDSLSHHRSIKACEANTPTCPLISFNQ